MRAARKIWGWFHKQNAPEPSETLRGAPPRVRRKTYSSSNGHVYQYCYRGWRALTGPIGVEHVFHLMRSPQNSALVNVRLLNAEILSCQEIIGRELLHAERYAITKLTLFAALDRIENASAFDAPLVPRAREMCEYLEALGRL